MRKGPYVRLKQLKDEPVVALELKTWPSSDREQSDDSKNLWKRG